MSHPKNKRERFLIGDHKARKRFYGETVTWTWPEEWTEEKKEQWFQHAIALRRKTTKLCSCQMCRNPRHSIYYKGDSRLTMQEVKFKQSLDL